MELLLLPPAVIWDMEIDESIMAIRAQATITSSGRGVSKTIQRIELLVQSATTYNVIALNTLCVVVDM